MAVFTLAVSCLITSSLSWFMDLRFHVSMQHFSLQHRALLSPSYTTTDGHCFCFDSTSSPFLELFFHSSPVACVCVCVLSCSIMSQLFAIPCNVGHQAPLSLEFSRQGNEVGSHSLLQGIFPTQGLNLGLQHCRQIPYKWRLPVAYWTPTDLGVYLSVSYLFAFSYCSWGSQGKNTEVVCHCLLQWTILSGLN